MPGKLINAIDPFFQVIIVINTVVHLLGVFVNIWPCVRRGTDRRCIIILFFETNKNENVITDDTFQKLPEELEHRYFRIQITTICWIRRTYRNKLTIGFCFIFEYYNILYMKMDRWCDFSTRKDLALTFKPCSKSYVENLLILSRDLNFSEEKLKNFGKDLLSSINQLEAAKKRTEGVSAQLSGSKPRRWFSLENMQQKLLFMDSKMILKQFFDLPSVVSRHCSQFIIRGWWFYIL